jgi:hypothetical protein
MADKKELFGIVAVVGIVGVAYLIFAQQASADTGSSSGSSGGDVGNLGSSDIQNYASNAGFEGDDLNTAVAVALAESSGNPSALGDLNLGVSVGLWQINLKAHPEYTQGELTDPQTNANAAYAIYSAAGNQFTPWTTYNTGAYEAYLT